MTRRDDKSRHIEALPVDDFDEERPEMTVVETLDDGRVVLDDGRVGRFRRDGVFAESGGAAVPFGAGNTAAVTHGAWSDRLVSERARDVLADLQVACPWIMEADGMVLDTLIKAKVRHDEFDDVINEYFDGARRNDKGLTGAEAIPDRILQQVAREARHVMDACGKLGLTATDRAALMKDTSWARALAGKNGGMAQVGEQGRAIREERGRA